MHHDDEGGGGDDGGGEHQTPDSLPPRPLGPQVLTVPRHKTLDGNMDISVHLSWQAME